MQGTWFAAGVSTALVLFTLIAVVMIIYWRYIRQHRRQSNTQDADDRAVQILPSDNDFGVSFNVTPPLPPPEGASDSEEEEDGAQLWSNGVVNEPH